MTLGLQHPELLLLLVPGAWIWWRARTRRPPVDALRLLALLVLGVALGQPHLERGARGRDLVLVVDRSRSMPPGSDARALELVALAEAARAEGDRVGVVAFGARAAVERAPAALGALPGFERAVDPDGSSLGDALEAALELVPAGRPGALLVVSDGEVHGGDPLAAARRARARGVRVDVLPLARDGRGDLAVLRVGLPEQVAAGEPFQFSAWVQSDLRVEAAFELTRDGARLARGSRVFSPGATRLVFRDRVDAPGLATYRLELLGAGDRFPENDVAEAPLGVRSGPRLLLVNHDGAPDALSEALRAAGLAVDVRAPEDAPLDRAGLEAYRAVLLENVAAGRAPGGLDDLRRFVLERGGGLLLTGGKAAFGVGGYHLSPVDALLPVSMELREEQRRQGIALAVALDRSGSMRAPAEGGRTKMDLANAGAAAAIELLSGIDAVAVLAVDSSAHVVQALTPAADRAPILRRVLAIEAGGGGIFTRTALEAAVEELARAQQRTRHVVLFADAADSEEQDGCPELVDGLARTGATLSVIALGTEQDSDAAFLEDLAARGGGEAWFTTRPDELPRLFAQDTLAMSRSTFVEEPTAVDPLPDLLALGALDLGAFPTLGGYNLTWLRPGATAGALARDSFRAPVLAFTQRGLGRTAAFTGQVGGDFGAAVVAWPGFARTFVTLARWLAGQEEPAGLYASVQREGRAAVLTVELDPDAQPAPDLSRLAATVGYADGTLRELELERVAGERLEARFALDRPGAALAAVSDADGGVLRLPPVALPYSPEFEPRSDARSGARVLRALAEAGGGAVDPAAADLFRGPREGRAWRPLGRELALVALLLVLLEIAVRRLALFDASARRRRSDAGEADAAGRSARRRRAERAAAAPQPRDVQRERDAPAGGAALGDALARARRRAGRELGR